MVSNGWHRVPILNEVLDSLGTHESEVQDRDGRWYLLRIRPYRTSDNKIEGIVVVLVDIDQLRSSQQAATELIEAVRATLREQYYLTVLAVPKELGRVAGGTMSRNPIEFFSDQLTPRQREVLVLLAHGKQAKEIANALNISVKTVDFHKGTLMDELGLRTTAELTRYAIANGLVSDPAS